MHTLPIVLALLGCLRPEEGIDRTRVVGTVRVDPISFEESGDKFNAEPAEPQIVDDLAFGYQILTGSLSAFDMNEAGGPSQDSDTDCWSLVTPVGRTASTEEGAPGPVAVDITLADLATSARVSVYNRDVLDGSGQNAGPTLVTEIDVVGWNLLTVELEAKINYSLCIAGLEGTGNVPYELVVSARHPDLAKILVGVYKNDDPKDRGALLGGTNALPFEPVDKWSFEAPYEMLFLREFETDTDGDVVVLDENVKEGFIYAGTWANLSQGLPAGTWYSDDPVHVDFSKPGEPETWGTFEVEDTGPADTDDIEYWEPPGQPTYPTVKVEEKVVVDAVAPIVIGQSIAEVEPNDMPLLDPTTEGDLAQDLGVLTGPGFVDIVTGSLDYTGYNYWNYYTDGNGDTFKFQVPETLELAFTLEWADSASDLDILVVDDQGATLDQGFYGFPEINEVGDLVLEPGKDYYIFVLLWVNAGTEPIPWTLKLEQLAP